MNAIGFNIQIIRHIFMFFFDDTLRKRKDKLVTWRWTALMTTWYTYHIDIIAGSIIRGYILWRIGRFQQCSLQYPLPFDQIDTLTVVHLFACCRWSFWHVPWPERCPERLAASSVLRHCNNFWNFAMMTHDISDWIRSACWTWFSKEKREKKRS